MESEARSAESLSDVAPNARAAQADANPDVAVDLYVKWSLVEKLYILSQFWTKSIMIYKC